MGYTGDSRKREIYGGELSHQENTRIKPDSLSSGKGQTKPKAYIWEKYYNNKRRV